MQRTHSIEFEEISLRLMSGARVGLFDGAAEILFEDANAAPFVLSISLNDLSSFRLGEGARHKLDHNAWGEWAIFKMLGDGILAQCAERIEAARAELFADELRAEAEQDEAERSPRLHGRA